MYVLRSALTGRFYVGSAEDVLTRLARHNAGRVPSTRNQCPWKVVYTEDFATRAEAVRREREVKNWKNFRYMCRKLRIEETIG